VYSFSVSIVYNTSPYNVIAIVNNNKYLLTEIKYIIHQVVIFLNLIQPTISLEMPVPSQGHYGFHSFPVVD